MKLYLSSYRIPNLEEFEKLVGKKANEINMVALPNAKDYYAARARNYKINWFLADMDELGIASDVCDLNEITDSDLLKKLSNYDVVWAIGGNTFCLREAMKKSGFDHIIAELLDQGVVFAGDSAGAVIASPSLKGIELADEPEFAETAHYDGLGIIPEFISPHVGNAEFAETTEEIRKMHIGNDKYIELSDSQAYIVNGEYKKIVNASP